MLKKYCYLLVCCFVLLILLVIFVFFRKRIIFNIDNNFSKVVNVYESYNDDFITACYGNFFKCEDIRVTRVSDVDTSVLGNHDVLYSASSGDNEKSISIDVKVVDRERPVIEVADEEIVSCPNNIDVDFSYIVSDNYDVDLADNVYKKIDGNNIFLIAFDSSFNVGLKKVSFRREDKVSPQIILNGSVDLAIPINTDFVDPGYAVSDNCDDDIVVVVEGEVDTSKEGTYSINYVAYDSSGNKSIISRKIRVYKPNSSLDNKVVYLTFDDGPSQYTGELLDILLKYNVKVTFFVTGRNSKYNHFITRAYNEGHSIGLHTDTHNYSLIYKSVDDYFYDLNLISEKVKNLTGSYSKLLRFPGGSSNTVSKFNPGIMSQLSKLVEEEGYKYFDWNVSSGDADGKILSPDEYAANVINGLGDGKTYIVLQHDTNANSIRSVSKIIEYGLSNGYSFQPLTNMSPTIHHRISN